MTKIVIGKRGVAEPEINVWLDTYGDGIGLVVKHSLDSSDQRVAFLEQRDGVLVLRIPKLAAYNLCKAAGIIQSSPITVLIDGE